MATAKKTPRAKRARSRKPPGPGTPVVAPDSPGEYRARVRMYRQGLGDCFLVTFPRKGKAPFNLLIDCGVLTGKADAMVRVVEHIRDTVREGRSRRKARLDVVVGTHEHKDHLSGFNQARSVFDDDFEFGSVWLGWTENLTVPEIKEIKQARKKAAAKLHEALASPLAAAAGDVFEDVACLLGFSGDAPGAGGRTIEDALDYLKAQGKKAGDLRFLEPGTGPLPLEGVEDVNVYVLGPPRDPLLLKGSEVTEQARREGLVYHLASTGLAGIDALSAPLDASSAAPGTAADRYHPFSAEHRLAEEVPDALNPGTPKKNPYYEGIRGFVEETYEAPRQAWRRIDLDWCSAFGQLALDLDSDTNNTSLVLAFEFAKTGEVLLFVGDAQVGNWRSWAEVGFQVPGRDKPLSAHELVSRTVFYKVGHHCSHNATLKKGGLELMTRDDLVAFIPLDGATAASMGRKDPATGKPRGWDMPASALYRALLERATKRVVISDASKPIPDEARAAGVVATDLYVDYFLR